MTGFRFASPAQTSAPREQLAGIQPVQFVLPAGVALTISHPLVKAAFEHLAKIWPRSATFDELITVARENLSEDDKKDNATKQQHEQLLGGDLLTAYAAAAVFLRTSEPHLVTEISAKPKVSALVQHQARTGQRITNQLHESLEADIFVRNILVLLDGDHDVPSMVTQLEKLAKTGAINVAKDGRQITGGNELRRSLETAVENSLELIAKSGFLIG